MARTARTFNVYLEFGRQRTFAGALEWPGWCRNGRDQTSALEALFAYGPRYGKALRSARQGFRLPADPAALVVVERLKGGATTDFGAPEAAPSADRAPLKDKEVRRLQAILRACWRAFDAAVDAGKGKDLRKGPRGGGRELEAIIGHVFEADAGYLYSVGWRFPRVPAGASNPDLASIRKAILEALASSARGELPARGPRGGVRWKPRYFVRRVAWHVLDHAWEIEDRIL